MIKVRSGKNLLSGLLFAGFGAVGLFVGRDYAVGSAFRMGAGYFPMIVGWALLLLGGWMAAMGLTVDGDRIEPIMARPLFFVLGSVVLFAILARPFGIVVATIVMTIVSRAGGWDFKPVEIVILAVILAAGSALVFVTGLGLPFSVWPR